MNTKEIKVNIPKECSFRQAPDCRYEKEPAKECRVDSEFPDDCPLIYHQTEYAVIDSDATYAKLKEKKNKNYEIYICDGDSPAFSSERF